MPLVVKEDAEHWIFVGKSYVHGVMNDEVWDESTCELMWSNDARGSQPLPCSLLFRSGPDPQARVAPLATAFCLGS